MAGRQASQSLVRYPGIQVQTSALGLNIPVGWGTFRCKCNLVDYLDFKSKPIKGGGGKGGAPTTSYDYDATIILAICEGPIDSIASVYVDGKIFTNGAHTAMWQASLNLATGAVGQPVWPYLTSNHPDHAIGYSGLALAYQSNYELASSASPPNHSFEVVRLAGFGVAGSEDADPSAVVTDFFTNGRYGVPSWAPGLLGDLTQYQDYCLAAGLLVSPVIDAQRSASEFLTELLRATNSTCVWSEGVLKFIPYGDTALSGHGKTYAPNNTPAYSLGDDDYIPQADGDDPLTIDIQDQSDAYNVIQLEYLDRTNQYNMAIALASDAANVAQYGMRRKGPDTVHCICDPNVAAISSQLYLQRTLYIRQQFRFTLGWQFALLEPGDILELTDSGLGLTACPVRITQIEDDQDGCRTILAEDFPVGVAHAPLYVMQTAAAVARNTNIDPGGVEANLLLWSDDPTNAAWGKSGLTVTGAAAPDQYGLATAAWLVPGATNSGHFLYQGFAAFPGLSYTYSVCLQQGTHRYVQIQISDFIASGVELVVDLNAGLILGAAAAFGTGVLVAAAVAPTLVAGVWQVTVTAQVPAATTLYGVVAVLDAGAQFTWTGDGSNAVLVSQQAVRQGVAPGAYAATGAGPAGPVIFNPPAALNDGGSSVFAAVAGGPNWGGCNVWASIDGTDYQEIGVIDAAARFGRLSAPLAGHADPDTADTVYVDLGWSGGALTGAAAAAVDGGATTSWIEGELIGFQAETLTHPFRYSLGTYLRRGFMNTPIAAHAAGALFVRMDQAVFDFPYLDLNTGQTIYIKFQSFNIYGQGLVSLADCLTYSVTPNPVAANAPGIAAWTVSALTITNAGAAVPVLAIAGAVDNPSAGAVAFFYRAHGASAWISAGAHPDDTTSYAIASIVSGAGYDVGVAYVVGGVNTAITQIGTNVGVGVAVAPSIVAQGALATANQATWSAQISGTPANLAALSGTEAINNATLQAALASGAVIPAQSATITGQGVAATAGVQGSYASLAAAVAGGILIGESWLNTTDHKIYVYAGGASGTSGTLTADGSGGVGFSSTGPDLQFSTTTLTIPAAVPGHYTVSADVSETGSSSQSASGAHAQPVYVSIVEETAAGASPHTLGSSNDTVRYSTADGFSIDSGAYYAYAPSSLTGAVRISLYTGWRGSLTDTFGGYTGDLHVTWSPD